MDCEARAVKENDREMDYYPCDICTAETQWKYGGPGRCQNGCPDIAIEYTYDTADLELVRDIPY